MKAVAGEYPHRRIQNALALVLAAHPAIDGAPPRVARLE
jgi:hypothetical protein